MDFWITPADNLSSALTGGPANREALATTAISRGATRLQSQDLEGAITEFKRAVAYNPNLTVAYQYQGRVYSMMGRRGDAVDAFERAVRTDPADPAARAELAKAYLADQRFAEAEGEFKQLARARPNDVGPHASLGYLYLSQGRLAEADTQMTRVTELAPRDPGAWKSLGLVRNAQGQYSEAVRMFKRSIELDPKYVDSYSELGFAYFGLEEFDKADEQVEQLRRIGTDRAQALAFELELSMLTPKIAYLDSSESTFIASLGPGTALSTLDPSLATPGAVATFTMTFRFNQPMDAVSMQTTTNWSISKALGGEGGLYNHGANRNAAREVSILPTPISVVYDPDKQTATVYFRVRQNAAGDGLIDPSHWVFQFSGTDAAGNAMDRRGDQYNGYVGAPY